MDTSDTSDFESADEYFSDSEDVADRNRINKNKVENKHLKIEKDLKESEDVDGKTSNTNIPELQKPQQCWEPGMDYDVENESPQKNDATIHEVVETLDNLTIPVVDIVCIPPKNVSEESEMCIPPIKTSCWFPQLNEANIKTEPIDFIPGPPKFDRDGNPINYKGNKSKEQDKQPEMNKDHLIAQKEIEIAEKDEEISQKGASNEAQTENTRNSEGQVSQIRTSCWVPALNKVSKETLEIRRENEKYPPKPPSVDRDGNSIIYKMEETKQTEEPKKKYSEHKENSWETDKTWNGSDDAETNKGCKLIVENDQSEGNLWDDNDQWDVEDQPAPKNQVSVEKPSEDLWREDYGAWGDTEESTCPRLPEPKPKSYLSSVNMWENDQWESVENELPEEPANKPLGSALAHVTEKDESWSNWSNWGLSSVLNTVSQGLTTVIGVPDPEELAKQHLGQKEEVSEEENDTGDSFVGLGTLVSEVTKLVETTGTKVISGGLGTLETIGKKTMEVLQENDPGLKKKRALLQPQKPVLSTVLREAKERAEQHVYEPSKKERRVDYEIMFDDYQGLVHFEALSMLSRQCSIKLSSILSHLTGPDLTDLKETLDQVSQLCELSDDPDNYNQSETSPADFRNNLKPALTDLGVPINFEGLLQAWEKLEEDMEEGASELYRTGVATLARFTSMAVEQMHRTGELLLVKESRSTVNEADSLEQICTALILMLNNVTSLFADKLNGVSTEETKEEVNQYITNIFFESSNSTRYIHKSFQLLIPVLQIGAT